MNFTHIKLYYIILYGQGIHKGKEYKHMGEHNTVTNSAIIGTTCNVVPIVVYTDLVYGSSMLLEEIENR